MLDSITIVRLQVFDGPNIYGPQAGLRFLMRCDQDRSRRLRSAIKDGAQYIGLMLAALTVESFPTADGVLIQVAFQTNAPAIAADLCRLLVHGINAEINHDDEWDSESPLLALQERVRAWALPVGALQLLAEARSRDIPTLRLPNGTLLFGTGASAWLLNPAELQPHELVKPPWPRIGAVPLVAVTGDRLRSTAVLEWAVRMAGEGRTVRFADNLDYNAVTVLLADSQAEALVVGLDTDDILQRGTAFERCAVAVVTDCAPSRPAVAADDTEWVRAVGLPILLARTTAYIGADPRLEALRPYASVPVEVWP